LLLFFLFHRSAHIPFYLLPCKSVNHVKDQIKANTFIYSLSLLPRFRFMTGVRKLSLAMYPCTISIDEHVGLPIKFLMTRRLKTITKIYFPTSMILKIILTDESECIYVFQNDIAYIYVNIFFPSIANLKCTLSDRKGSPKGTCIPVWEPLV